MTGVWKRKSYGYSRILLQPSKINVELGRPCACSFSVLSLGCLGSGGDNSVQYCDFIMRQAFESVNVTCCCFKEIDFGIGPVMSKYV